MNNWQVGDVRISCVVEFKSPAAYHPEHGMIIGATPEVIGCSVCKARAGTETT